MKTLPFRLYAQILIFTGLVALGGLILWPLQQALYGGMIGVRDDIINRLENQIGRRIRYSSISPSIFGSFDVRNVRILGEDERSVLSMSRLRIVYSFIDLLRGRSLAIRSVRIDSPHIDLDTARDHDLLNMLETAKTGQGDSLPNFLDILPEKLLVQVRNGKCLVYSSGDLFDLDSLNLSAEISGDMVILDGRWNIGVMMDKLIGKPVIMRLVMRADGSFRSNMEEGEAVLSITSISGDAETAAPFSFGFALKERTVSLWKMHDQLPLDLSLEYGLDEGNFNASFACSDFMLRDYFNFSGGLEGARQFLNIAGSGSANVMRSREGNLGYSVDFAGEALALPGVLQDQAIDASFGIFASGDEKKVRIDKLYFSMPPTGETETEAFFFGSISFSGDLALGPFAPEGIVSLGDFSLTGKDGLNGQISVSTSAYSGEISAFSETLSFGQGDQAVDLTAFAASLYPSGDALDLTVSALRFMNTESYDNVRMGSFSLTGTLDTAARTARAGIILDSFSAGDLAFMAMPFVQDLSIRAPLMAALRSTSVTTEFSFSTDFDHFLFDAPRLVFAGYAAKGFVGLFSVSGSDSHFELNEGRIIWGDDAMRFSGKAEFSNPENIVFSANAGYGDMEYIIEGEILEGKSIGIHGSHGLDVSLTASGGGAYSGYIRTESYPMPFLGYQLGNTGAFGSLGGASANRGLSGPAWAPALLTIDAKMNYETASAWSIELDMLEIAGITSPAGLAQIQLAGNADQNGANFPLLFYRDNIGALSGRASVSWPPGLPGFSGTAALAGGKENYLLDVSGGIGRLNLRLAGTAMRLDRVFGMSNNFVADGNVNLSWETAEVFLAELNLSSFTGKVLDQEFRASARAVLDSGGCSVSNLRLNLAGIEAAVPQFSISGRRGTAEASAELKGILGGKRLEGNLSLAASFSPIRSWLRIEDLLNSVAGKVHFDAFRFGDTGDPQAFDIGFSRSDGGLSVSGGPRDMVRLHMDREGNFFAGLSSPFPLRGSAVGSIKNKMIDVHCSNLYIDLAGLFDLLPKNKGIFLTGGYVNATVDIRGSITDPGFYGTARGTSLRIRIPDWISTELRPIPFNVVIDGNDMNFGPVATAVGAGAGTVSGRFSFDRWIPNIFSLDITVPRETPIPYGFDIAGFTARGSAAGQLNISMESMILDVSGDLYANNSELGINSDEINAQGRGALANNNTPVVVDLTVSTGPTVEFLYPNANFPILRANPDIGSRIHVTADSLAQQFSLTSDIRIRSGEIFYFERSFYIRSGMLLLRENEIRFDPRLTARAELRDRTDEGPVTISMIVDNAPLLSFTARFESSPSLSQMEILLLLGQSLGVPGMSGVPADDASYANRAFVSSTSDLLAQLLVVRQLEQQIRNFMRLDMFSVRTQVLQNAVFIATGFMQAPVDRISGVGNYFDNTTVFGGKYIGQDMFVQGMLSMRYDANKETFGGLTLVPDFGLELQSPVFNKYNFLIRWDFVPAHPENWYVNDNSITLRWSRTY